MALLLNKEVAVLTKNNDFANVFSKKSVEMPPEKTGINEPIIKLVNGKQLTCGSIYSLTLVEFKI